MYTKFRADNPCVEALAEEMAVGFKSVVAVVECAFVDVHANERVGGLRVEIARELHCVGQGFFTMFQSVLDALAERLRYGRDQLRAQGSADCIPPQRKRQTGDLLPPFAEIDDPMQARL